VQSVGASNSFISINRVLGGSAKVDLVGDGLLPTVSHNQQDDDEGELLNKRTGSIIKLIFLTIFTFKIFNFPILFFWKLQSPHLHLAKPKNK
jgi:hypothetical protein